MDEVDEKFSDFLLSFLVVCKLVVDENHFAEHDFLEDLGGEGDVIDEDVIEQADGVDYHRDGMRGMSVENGAYEVEQVVLEQGVVVRRLLDVLSEADEQSQVNLQQHLVQLLAQHQTHHPLQNPRESGLIVLPIKHRSDQRDLGELQFQLLLVCHILFVLRVKA